MPNKDAHPGISNGWRRHQGLQKQAHKPRALAGPTWFLTELPYRQKFLEMIPGNQKGVLPLSPLCVGPMCLPQLPDSHTLLTYLFP